MYELEYSLQNSLDSKDLEFVNVSGKIICWITITTTIKTILMIKKN